MIDRIPDNYAHNILLKNAMAYIEIMNKWHASSYICIQVVILILYYKLEILR